MKKVEIFLFAVVSLIILICLRGASVMLAWEWFVVPILNVQKLSFIEALGITIVVAVVFMNQPSKMERDYDEDYYKALDEKDADDNLRERLSNFIYSVFYILTPLGIGWIIKQFM